MNQPNNQQQNAPNPNPNIANPRREEQSRNRQFFFIIALYVMMTLLIHMTKTPDLSLLQYISSYVNNNGTDLVPQLAFNLMKGNYYQGTWSALPSARDNQTQKYWLTNNEGKLKIFITMRHVQQFTTYGFQLQAYNGKYSDDGIVHTQVVFNVSETEIMQQNDLQANRKSVIFQIKKPQQSISESLSIYQQILHGTGYNYSFISLLKFNFTAFTDKNKIKPAILTIDYQLQQSIDVKEFYQLRNSKYQKYHKDIINNTEDKVQIPTQTGNQTKNSQNNQTKTDSSNSTQNTENVQTKKTQNIQKLENKQEKQQLQQTKKQQVQKSKQTANKIQEVKKDILINQTPISSENQQAKEMNKSNQSIQTEQKIAKDEVPIKIAYRMSLNIKQELSEIVPIITFAGLMFYISYTIFSSLIQINRQIGDGLRDPGNFSFWTWLIVMGWDMLFCFSCFNQAFTSSQQSAMILFIMPAFLFALIFMNLEPKIMIYTYRAQIGNDLDIRQLLCRFNIYNYIIFFSTIAVVILTNFNNVLPISLCFIFLPQIWTNGINGIRPDIWSGYYTKFLLSRFAIIFYLRGFPFNAYDFKPDYFLCLTCTSLVLFQFFILWIQKNYGPKTVIPNFFLPPVFNYGCQQQLQNIQQGGEATQCTICLLPLYQNPDVGQSQQPEIKHKVMKTPCKHKYHGVCLVQWMKIKMQCPQCRSRLPPYQ